MRKGSFCYPYPRPALTTDCVIFGFDEGELKVLLIKRTTDPFRGKWALPGGFVNMDETTEACAKRILIKETGLKGVFIEQLFTLSDLNRDPRERIISVAYYALLKISDYVVTGGEDAAIAQWHGISTVPKLAFDHNKIVKVALDRLRGKVRYVPIGFELLSEKFTLTQLQHLYEAILGASLDKRNFRKKFLKMKLLKPLTEKQEGVAHKAARFHIFDKKKYAELTSKGFNFEI
jgi:8-oxo-dGTP diphosphatase